MISACIFFVGRTGFHIIRNGALTDHQCRDEILRVLVVPYVAGLRVDLMLMGGNCRPHRSNWMDYFLFEEGIIRIEWPACFLDNRACLEYSRQINCCSPITPKISSRTGKGSPGEKGQNTPAPH
ncbi:transposable element Tcb2 transposase [Trichonephila clavipes]|nr:transposable element Tcb2 transposase [Trichonephila clavipes]